jgi:hypothetical protein
MSGAGKRYPTLQHDDKSYLALTLVVCHHGKGPTLMAKKPKKTEPFGVQQYLSNAGVSRRLAKFKKGQVIFSQDDPAMTFYTFNQEMPS